MRQNKGVRNLDSRYMMKTKRDAHEPRAVNMQRASELGLPALNRKKFLSNDLQIYNPLLGAHNSATIQTSASSTPDADSTNKIEVGKRGRVEDRMMSLE